MKVLALTPYPPAGPSSRVRVYQLVPGLAAHGVHLEVAPFLSERAYSDRFGEGRRITVDIAASTLRSALGRLKTARHYDAVLISKYLTPVFPARTVKIFTAQCRHPIILDVDDSVFHRRDTRSLAQCAAVVVVGNRYLEALAKDAGARRTKYIPSVVDAGMVHHLASAGRSGPRRRVNVGWVGTQGTYREYLAPLLSDLVRACQEVGATMTVIGPRTIAGEVTRQGAVHEVWSLECEGRLLSRLDIGLMPLVDDSRSRGKCAYKAVQYGAHGIPCVAGRVGAARSVIEDGVTGFLASDADCMLDRVRQLARDGELRRKMGEAARARISVGFSLEYALAEWLEIFQDVGARAGRF